MANFFDRQKFQSELMARGISMTNDEIDNYLDTQTASEGKPKSYLPYKNQQVESTGFTMPTLEDQYQPPAPKENAALDFVGNMLWEAMDVGTFGAVGALDYNDYLENIVTTGGPGTFAGRVGAGVGGLLGFMPPMGIVKAGAGALVKAGKYGSKTAAKNMVKAINSTEKVSATTGKAIKGSTILGRTKYKTLSPAKQDEIWSPFVDQLNKYGHSLDNLAKREKFLANLNETIRPTIVSQLKKSGIKPNNATITQIEKIVKEGMGAATGSAMPIWNLQQRIAVRLGSSVGAGKIATIASHVMEEAAIFAAVETPMEFFNAIDEFRDADYGGTMAHALGLGTALGFIRFIPGGKDQPIIKTAFHRLNKMFHNKRSYRDLDYGTQGGRDILSSNVKSMFGVDKKLFNVALGDKASKELGIDMITSNSMAQSVIDGTFKVGGKAIGAKKGSQFMADAMGNIEKNWTKRWWGEFWKESMSDMGGSLGRMTAGAIAFNHDLIFDEYVPLEDKVFNVLVGAFMTKRGRSLDYIDSNGKRTAWEITQRPWTYSEEIMKIDKHLKVLGLEPEPFFQAMVREGELRNEILDIAQTEDVKSIMEVMEKHKVIVSKEEAVKEKSKPEDPSDHELYSYLEALSGFYIHRSGEKRMLTAKELTKKQLNAIEQDLLGLELIGTKDGKGLQSVSDMQGIVYDANSESVMQLLDLYKTTVRDMYAVSGLGEAGNTLDVNNLIVAKFNKLDISKLMDENPDAYKAMEKVMVVRDLLERHGLLKRSDSENPQDSMKLNLDEHNQAKIIETMARLENNLHQLVYKGESVGSDYLIQIGDGFLENVINTTNIFKSVRDSYAKFQSLREGGNAWVNSEKTGLNDRAKISDLIQRVFTAKDDTGLLAKRVLISEGLSEKEPADLLEMQTFANTILDILPHTTTFGTPTGFELSDAKTISISDIRELKRLFYNNGMGGFSFKGEELARYVNEFKGYALDQKLSSATTNDGKVITGIDRAKVGALVQSGLVNDKLEIIPITRVIDKLALVQQDIELWDKLIELRGQRGQDKLPLTKDLADRLSKLVPETSLEETLKEFDIILADLQDFARTYDLELNDVANNMLSKYNKHISKYIKGKKGGILSIRGGMEAEADLATITELITKLDNIEKTDLKASHASLMETLTSFAQRDGLTMEQQEFVTNLRTTFWNKPSESSKVVSLLARYGYDKEILDKDGNPTGETVFSPLYNQQTNKLDLGFKGAEEQMKIALKDMEQHIPIMARSELVKQRMEELTNEKLFESDVNNSITPQSFLEKYNLVYNDKDLLEGTLKMDDPVAQFILAGANLKDKDGKVTPYSEMKPEQRLELVDDTIRLMFTLGTSRKINRLTVGENAGVYSDFDNTMTDNHLFRFLDNLVGIGNFKVVGRKVETVNGIVDSRDHANGSLNMLKRILHDGYAAIDVKGRADDTGKVMKSEPLDGHIFIGIGDYSWGIAIPKNKASDVYDMFGAFLESSKKKYPKKYGPIFKRLNKLYEDKGVLLTEGAKRTYQESEFLGDSNFFEAATTMMWMDGMAKDIWWDHLKATQGKNDYESSLAVAKWSKRIRLMSNVSSKEMSNDHVSRVINLHETYKTLDAPLMDNMKSMQKNEGLNLVMVQDEGADAKIFSTMENYLKQINKENKDGNISDAERDTIIPGKEGLEIHDQGKKRGDASIADSVMLMPVKWFKALQALAGFSSQGKIGGIKPLISSVGDGLLLGKTAILPDNRFDGFFNSNKDVHAILMMSGVKMNKGVVPIDVKNMAMEALQTGGIATKDYISTVKWQDINMGPAVSVDHSATISYQLTNEMAGHHSNSFYEWLIAGKVGDYELAMKDFADSRNSIGSTAFARALSEPGTGDNAALSVMDMWLSASNGGGPIHFTGVLPTFKNSFKRRFVDKGMLQLHNEHGGQSVMSPFMGGPGQDLRNTTFRNVDGERKTWTIGQGEIGSNNAGKIVPTNRLNIVRSKKGAEDELITYAEMLKDPNFVRSIKKVTGNNALGQNERLDVVHKVLQDYNQTGSGKKKLIYEVLPGIDMYEMPPVRGVDGQDIWKASSQAKAQAQADEMRFQADKRNENYFFAEKIEKHGKAPGVYILKDLKPGRGDDKLIYVGKAFDKMKDSATTRAEIPIKDRKGRKAGTKYMKFAAHEDTHEVAMVWHRTPSTRQSDKIVIGLKGFVDSKLGNQARLNPWDTYSRAEADFDIDKINYWWDTPDDILRLWQKNAGKTPFVSEELQENKTTMKAGYDWLNPPSMERLAGDIAHAEKMRGITVKAQRLVQFLSQYNSLPGQTKGFVFSLKGKTRKNIENGDQRIVFDHTKLDENRHLLAEDIQRVVDSYNGYNRDLYSSDWLGKFLFGEGDRYQGVFRRESYNARENKWDVISGKTEKGQSSFTAVEQEIINAVIAPYRSLLQAGTNIYEGGEAKAPRYDDLVEMMSDYDSHMGNLTKRVYKNLKYKHRQNSEMLYKLDDIFMDEGKMRSNIFGNFGEHASTRLSKEPNMPFERMLSVIAYGDKFNQDSPKKLWGPELEQFEATYNKLMGATGQARQDVYKQMNYDLKGDLGKLKFMNYLKWREDQQRNQARNARNDGDTKYAASITESLAATKAERLDLEKKMVNEDGIIRELWNIAAKRITNDILDQPGRHKYGKLGVPQFNDFNHAKNWLNNNRKIIMDAASKQPLKYKAISSPEYRDALIFHEILSKYENIFIDPSINSGANHKEFADDLYKFKQLRNKLWRGFFEDKKGRVRQEPWQNESRIMNALTTEFTNLFDKWNDSTNGRGQDGLGMLMLWKAMMPVPVKGEYTYYNGKLAPAFRESSMGMVKFGLRFLANADETRISKFQKKMFFDIMTSQYTDWYDFFTGKRQTTTDGMRYRDMYDMSINDTYDNPSPLVEFWRDKKVDESKAEQLNPLLHSMFGVDTKYSYGFVGKDPTSAAAMKERTDRHVYPRGYIPIHYRGGDNPRITGWDSWNKARSGEAYLMLGESLNKNILGFREQPIIKNTFNEVNSKPEGRLDIIESMNRKGQSEENGSNPDC